MKSRAARMLLRLVPLRRRPWVEAALAGAEFVNGAGDQRAWNRSSAILLVREALMHRVPVVVATLGAIVVIAFLERSPSDDASQFTLAAILLSAGLLGAWANRRAWLVGIVIGSVVAMTHVISLAARIPEPGVQLPPGWANTTSLFVLVIPAVIAAYVGAALRRLLTSHEPPPAT
jgi:hypothetical protein